VAGLALSLAGQAVQAETKAPPLAPAKVEAPAEPRSFTSFADLRGVLLDQISGATHRIWLATEYLTDGEIVSALYIAQYRKLDVQVLLGRAKANSYMSRLNYLKNQNVPVFLRPASLKLKHPTALLLDDQLYWIDGELDFLARYRKFTLVPATSEEQQRFAAAFAKAAHMKLPAVPRALPLVGHAHRRPAHHSAGYLAPPAPHYDANDGSDAYTYSRRPTPRPEGVAAKLPKATKLEQRERTWTPKSPDDRAPGIP